MKKVLLLFALILGTSVLVCAQQVEKQECKNQSVETTVVAEEDFKVVELSALPEKVQEAVNKLSGENTVKEIAWNEETKQAKVTLTVDDADKVVLLDEEGKEIN